MGSTKVGFNFYICFAMNSKQNILDKLKSVQHILNKCGVKSIGLFGSYVKNEQSAGSDIDILIDFEEGKENYDNLLATCDVLEQLFIDAKVEIITKNGLSPFIGPSILREVQYV